MNCQDCDQIWNQLLDAEPLSRARVATGLEPSPQLLAEREQAACTHALGCPRCRLVRARYETLRRALRVWVSSARPEMTLSPALVERILAEQKAGSSRRARRWRGALPLGAAVAAVACLIALVLAPLPWRLERVSPGIDRGRPAGRASGSALRPSNRQADSRVLSEALADATAASWDLARTTSEPAARLGRQVLESATQVENPSRAGIRRRSCRFFVPRPGLTHRGPPGRSASAAGLCPASASGGWFVGECPPPVVHRTPGLRVPADSVAREERQQPDPPARLEGSLRCYPRSTS
jgi:hypothetical protein